uniref:Uncharacterized protein n=1 Tax=Solanum lycopersicum TaxID=4081 RepID=A0A3Q7IIG5_SOLLC
MLDHDIEAFMAKVCGSGAWQKCPMGRHKGRDPMLRFDNLGRTMMDKSEKAPSLARNELQMSHFCGRVNNVSDRDQTRFAFVNWSKKVGLLKFKNIE